MRGLKNCCLLGLLVLAMGWGATESFAQEKPIESYLSSFPAHTNSLMILRVKELKNSPKAEAAGWNDNDSSMWVAGTDPLPHWVTTIVRAAHSHLQQSSRDWAMSVTPMPESLPFSSIVRTYGQKTQTLHDRPVFLTTSGVYVTALTKDTIGVQRPADRADLGRWIEQAQKNTEPIIPEYLQKVANTPGQVVLAYDLDDAIDPWILREWLKSTDALKGQNTQIQAMSEMLETIEGMTLAISVTDQLSAELTLDFTSKLSPIAKKFPALLNEYLRHQGAVLEDLESAKAELSENSIVLKMDPLSDSGFQRLMSLILSPSPGHSAQVAQSTEANPPKEGADSYDYNAEPTVEATHNYYDAIEEMLGDVEKRNGPNYLATAVWHERYAQKIDHLPITGVDPELMTYGRETSARLVALASSLRGTPLEINTLNNAITYKVQPEFGGGGWWGGGGLRTADGPVPTGYQFNSNVTQIREQQAQAVMAGSKDRDQIWQIQIDERNKVRQEMYKKYKVDFGTEKEEQKKK